MRIDYHVFYMTIHEDRPFAVFSFDHKNKLIIIIFNINFNPFFMHFLHTTFFCLGQALIQTDTRDFGRFGRSGKYSELKHIKNKEQNNVNKN
jgi:hypothetical protein